jgi:hypothetical protein
VAGPPNGLTENLNDPNKGIIVQELMPWAQLTVNGLRKKDQWKELQKENPPKRQVLP